MENEKTISELLDSLNDSIDDIRSHPTKITKVPSNFEIILTGVNGEKGLDFLFSSGLDRILEKLFDSIMTGNFDIILNNEEKIRKLCDVAFGEGSFRGPVSNRVLNSIQNSVSSYKFQTMKSFLGKTVTQLKKIRLVMKNLEKEKKNIKDKQELEKYKESLYAIKQVLKIAEKVYRNRKLVNRKLYKGLSNIVHEEENKE